MICYGVEFIHACWFDVFLPVEKRQLHPLGSPRKQAEIHAAIHDCRAEG